MCNDNNSFLLFILSHIDTYSAVEKVYFYVYHVD